MGASREGFNLFSRYGQRHLWSAIRQRRLSQARLYVFRDTLTPLLCWLSGAHEFYWRPDPVNEPEEVFCNWCHTRKPIALEREGEN